MCGFFNILENGYSQGSMVSPCIVRQTTMRASKTMVKTTTRQTTMKGKSRLFVYKAVVEWAEAARRCLQKCEPSHLHVTPGGDRAMLDVRLCYSNNNPCICLLYNNNAHYACISYSDCWRLLRLPQRCYIFIYVCALT